MITLNHIRPKNPGVIRNKRKSKAYNPPPIPNKTRSTGPSGRTKWKGAGPDAGRGRWEVER